MTTLTSISISESAGIQLELHWAVILVAFVILLAVALYKKLVMAQPRYLEFTEAEIGTDGVKAKYKANAQDQQVGYMFWVELSTRKIGLPIDEDNDVIVEVYNSWYEFFKVSRELIKGIPATKLQENESTQQLVRLTIHILNSDLRQHLTMWQAKYRRWWELKSADPQNSSLSPQVIQKQYPEYQALMTDMKTVNANLIAYKDRLRKMVVGDKKI